METRKNTVTIEDIEAKIKREDYSKIGKKTTLLVMTLHNGFEICVSSGCVDAKNYDQEIGNEIVRKKAIDKLWELEGYKLQDYLYTKDACMSEG